MKLMKMERDVLRRERKAADARMSAAKAATLVIVQSGKCPLCGSKLRYNGSLPGWWQCSQFGAEGFRADSKKANCDWQGFTE